MEKEVRMTDDVARANRHARLRWVGAPLLLSGVSLIAYAVYGWLTGGSGWTVAASFFGTGLALASFGANHDAAMGYALLAQDAGLPPTLQDELEAELVRDRAGVMKVRPAPTIGMVMPVVAIGVQTFVLWRLLAGIA